MIVSVVDRQRRVEMMEAEEATAIWIATTEGATRIGIAGGQCTATLTEGVVEEEAMVEVGEMVVEGMAEGDQGGAAAEGPLRWLRG
jgi:hypothetical protein